jgi:plastocyanin
MMKSVVMLLIALSSFSSEMVAGTIAGKVSPGKSVVYIDTIPGKIFSAPFSRSAMDQKNLVFVPHILVIQQGTTVDFLNSDNVQHNVFWPSISGNKKLGHNMGTWPKNEKRPFQFEQPGIVPLLCNVHPEMFAYIVVSPTPYFAETDAGGNYHIDDVPDGRYSIVAWHEGMKQQSKPVDVSGVTHVDFSLSK